MTDQKRHDMHEYFGTDSYKPSALAIKVDDNPLRTRKHSARPFRVVFKDPVLRAELKRVLDEAKPTEQELQGLPFYAIQRLKDTLANNAKARFKARHNLYE